MARSIVADPIAVMLTLSSLAVLMATRVNSILLIAAGAAVGLARMWW
jgi:hypothetical protein